MLLIDPATGGMWTLSPDTIAVNFTEAPNPAAKVSAPPVSQAGVQPMSEQTGTVK